MPINVAHEPDPRLIAQAGYMAGMGKAYLRERDYYDKQNQEAYARYVDEWKRSQQLEQEQYNRSQDSFKSGVQLDEMGYERAYKERDYQTGFDQQQFQNELSADAHNRQWEQVDVQNRRYDVYEDRNREQAELRRQEMAAKYNAEYQFTDEQKQQQHRLQQQIQSVQTDPTLNDQERAYAQQQLQSQFDAIQPQLVPKQGPTAQEQFEQSLVKDPETGLKFFAQSDGKGGFKYEAVKDESAKTAADAEKKRVELDAQMQTKAFELATKQSTIKDANGNEVHAPPQEIGMLANQIYRQWKAAFSENPQGAGFGGGNNDPMNAPGQMGQPGVAQVDPGAQQNAQMRQVEQQAAQIHAQMMQAAQAGDKQTAAQLAMQLKQLAMGG